MRVAIVGRGRWFYRVQNEPLDTSVWVARSAFPRLACRVDRIFEVHDPEIWAPWAGSVAELLTVIFEHPTIVAGHLIKVDRLLEEFGPVFTSTIAWMLGTAIQEGVEAIVLHGVDMANQEEYAHQRDAVMYLIGLARGRGIEVEVPEWSGMSLNKKLYPGGLR